MAETASIKATLTRKVGGVPTYVYLGVGVAVLSWYLIRRHNRKLAAAAAGSANGSPTGSDNAATQIPNVPAGSVGAMAGVPWGFSGQFPNFNPPQDQGGTPTNSAPKTAADFDYSQFGPYANFIESYIYQGPFGHPSDEKGLTDWEGWIQARVNQGMTVQQAENAAVAYLYQGTPQLANYDPGKTVPSGTIDSLGFYHGPLFNPVAATPAAVANPAANPAVAGSPTAYATATK